MIAISIITHLLAIPTTKKGLSESNSDLLVVLVGIFCSLCTSLHNFIPMERIFFHKIIVYGTTTMMCSFKWCFILSLLNDVVQLCFILWWFFLRVYFLFVCMMVQFRRFALPECARVDHCTVICK